MSGDPKNRPELKGSWWFLFWVVLTVILFISLRWLPVAPVARTIPYTEFKAELEKGNVTEITIRGQQVSGMLATSPDAPSPSPSPDIDRFVTTLPPFDDPELVDLLDEQGVTVKVEADSGSNVGSLLITLLPLLFIVALLVYSSRMVGQQGGIGGRLAGFGKSKAKRYEVGSSDVTFDDVAGLDNAKSDLREIIDFLRDPERFRGLGAKIPRGILLMGPPGTGKTLLARASAGEAGVPFFSISGSEFVEMFVGVGASRVRDMFENAKKEAPAIIFIDEIDSVGRARGTGLGGGHDEREQTLNQILAEMDGFTTEHTVVVMAATNRPDVLDPALLRPGRFDRKVTLELPQKKTRRQILDVHTRKVPLAEDVDLAELAGRTVGFSGADLENLVNEAALHAARSGKEAVDHEDFEQARDKILFGGERDDLIVESEKRTIAYHEAGHALMALLLPHTDPLEKVTIIPRGRALGATEQVPAEDRHNLSRSYLLDRVAVLLGGRVAERIVFDDDSSGAEDDLRQVTQIVRRMICQWGMSKRLGAVSLRAGEEHVFLGREMAQPKDFSEHTARMVDEEIRTTIQAMEEKTERVLSENRDKLDALARALLESETLYANEINLLLGLRSTRGSQGKLVRA